MTEKKSRLLLACSMIEPEIKTSLAKNGVDLPTVWMDSGLHEKPDLLRAALQKEIDAHQDFDEILMGFCLCGNSVLDLTGHQASLIIPKFDDCIRMIMTTEQGKNSNVRPDCLYYTGGWMDRESPILKNIDDYMKKYGEKKARRAMALMYANYHGLQMIDNGAYRLEDYRNQAEKVASALNLELGVCQGTIRVIDKLLTGHWDEEFIIIAPEEKVDYEHFEGRTL